MMSNRLSMTIVIKTLKHACLSGVFGFKEHDSYYNLTDYIIFAGGAGHA